MRLKAQLMAASGSHPEDRPPGNQEEKDHLREKRCVGSGFSAVISSEFRLNDPRRDMDREHHDYHCSRVSARHRSINQFRNRAPTSQLKESARIVSIAVPSRSIRVPPCPPDHRLANDAGMAVAAAPLEQLWQHGGWGAAPVGPPRRRMTPGCDRAGSRFPCRRRCRSSAPPRGSS
jgi:hypothetical protein